jgi:biotin transport system substrate-specific component
MPSPLDDSSPGSPPRPAADGLAATHRLVWTALLAACIAVGAWLQLPIGPVPVTLQPLFIILAGFLLGPASGAAAVALYVLAGVLGMPVFAGGKAGLGVLLGPTGGYLVGFILAAAVAGLAARRGEPLGWTRAVCCGLLGILVAYAVGVAWLARALQLGMRQAVVAGFVPFILPDVVKTLLAVVVARRLRAQGLAPR